MSNETILNSQIKIINRRFCESLLFLKGTFLKKGSEVGWSFLLLKQNQFLIRKIFKIFSAKMHFHEHIVHFFFKHISARQLYLCLNGSFVFQNKLVYWYNFYDSIIQYDFKSFFFYDPFFVHFCPVLNERSFPG